MTFKWSQNVVRHLFWMNTSLSWISVTAIGLLALMLNTDRTIATASSAEASMAAASTASSTAGALSTTCEHRHGCICVETIAPEEEKNKKMICGGLTLLDNDNGSGASRNRVAESSVWGAEGDTIPSQRSNNNGRGTGRSLDQTRNLAKQLDGNADFGGISAILEPDVIRTDRSETIRVGQVTRPFEQDRVAITADRSSQSGDAKPVVNIDEIDQTGDNTGKYRLRSMMDAPSSSDDDGRGAASFLGNSSSAAIDRTGESAEWSENGKNGRSVTTSEATASTDTFPTTAAAAAAAETFDKSPVTDSIDPRSLAPPSSQQDGPDARTVASSVGSAPSASPSPDLLLLSTAPPAPGSDRIDKQLSRSSISLCTELCSGSRIGISLEFFELHQRRSGSPSGRDFRLRCPSKCLRGLRSLSFRRCDICQISTMDAFVRAGTQTSAGSSNDASRDIVLDRFSSLFISTGRSRMLDNLHRLDLSDNRIDTIDLDVIRQIASLEILDLSRNRLTGLDWLGARSDSDSIFDSSAASTTTTPPPPPPRDSSRRTNLIHLDLSMNLITSLDNAFSCNTDDPTAPDTDPQFTATITLFERLRNDFYNSSLPTGSSPEDRNCGTGSTLEYLDLSWNQLNLIANETFVDMLNLRLLNLSHNFITDIQPNAFVMTRNQSTKSADSAYDSQEYYYISSAACVRGWPNIDAVDLSHNNLTELRYEVFAGALCNVRQLNFSHNYLQQLPRYLVEHLPYLERIDLSWNSLYWLDVGTFTNPSLSFVDLSRNRLRKIISMTFLYLPMSTEIDLSHNDINFIYKFAFYRMCSKAGGQVRVTLSHNKLDADSVWKMLSTFQHFGNNTCTVNIDLGHNQITHLLGDAVEFVKERLAYADVIDHFSHWKNIRIDLVNNSIHCNCRLKQEVELLERVYYSICGNDSVNDNINSWKRLPCWEESGAFLPAATVSGYMKEDGAQCPKTTRCFLEGCDCSWMEAKLVAVNCSNRGITEFPDFRPPEVVSFSSTAERNHLSDVRSLDISRNKLRTLDAEILLRQLPALEMLYLNDNRLSSIPPQLAASPHLRVLTAGSNPFSCNCTAVWWTILSQNKTISRLLLDWNALRCTDGQPVRLITATNACNSRVDEKTSEKASAIFVLVTSATAGMAAFLAVVAVTVACLRRAYKKIWRPLQKRKKNKLLKYSCDDLLYGRPRVLILADKSAKRWTDRNLTRRIKKQRNGRQAIVKFLEISLNEKETALFSLLPKRDSNGLLIIVVLSNADKDDPRWAKSGFRKNLILLLSSYSSSSSSSSLPTTAAAAVSSSAASSHQILLVTRTGFDLKSTDTELYRVVSESAVPILRAKDPLFANDFLRFCSSTIGFTIQQGRTERGHVIESNHVIEIENGHVESESTLLEKY